MELLIVIVVIGILAAITVVAYTGITNSASVRVALDLPSAQEGTHYRDIHPTAAFLESQLMSYERTRLHRQG
ncbi:hypothetical protein [Protaetiibacter sp. SSC-01]|uniref:hypothetical protein n=1 Tax=Protaetiibacter sp. SSC-01 TaxID=2759943 RepID=UPI001CA39772|nr:hypothetical protein [Protaetiibacter sp. SSC-01]